MENKLRMAVGASALACAVAGVAFTGWSIFDWVMSAPMLTRFLMGVAAGGAGIFVAAESIKR